MHKVFNTVIEAINEKCNDSLIVIDDPGGSGKSYIYLIH